MKASQQFRKGIKAATRHTGISFRQASLKAGYNENQVTRFISGGTDIYLTTLDDICRKGYGMSFDTVFRMGA